MMFDTNVTVIITTLNAESYIELLLDSLKQQNPAVESIMVIDSGSTDETVELSRRSGVKVIETKPGSFDHGATRNLGALEAETGVIVFMTQDAVPVNNSTITKLIEPLKQNNIIVSYARQLPKVNAKPLDKYLRYFNYPSRSVLKDLASVKEQGIRAFQSSNVCAAYRREEFMLLGCFEEPIVCNEDMLFAARAIFAGYSVAYNAEAMVWHSHDYRVFQLFRRYFDIGASLELDQRIVALGHTEKSGLSFLKGLVNYLKEEGRLDLIPLALIETLAKYAGFFLGRRHWSLPKSLKPILGLNRLYWIKAKKI